MDRLARWCVRRRRVVLAAWLVALVAVVALGNSVGAAYSSNFSLPNSPSTQALNLLKADFPAQSGDTDQIVFETTSGTLTSPTVERRITAMLARVRHIKGVAGVVSPFGPAGVTQLAKGDAIGFADVIFSAQAMKVSGATVDSVVHTAQAAADRNLQVSLGGNAIENRTQGGGSQSSSDVLGVIFAAVILFIAFGSFFAMLMPLLTALVAVGMSISFVDLLTHVYGVASFAPILAALIGLGVGVDYALFVITRHRAGIKAGRSVEDSVATALDTSGRAVLFAGATVAIALLGQFVLGLSFLYGVAVSATITVALTVLASLTLLPAMLGFLGPKVIGKRERLGRPSRLWALLNALGLRGMAGRARAGRPFGEDSEEVSGFWLRWARWIENKSIVMALIGLAVVAVLALPTLNLRLGISDAGSDPPGTTTLQAYNTLAKGFGPGTNGPFLVTAQLTSPAARSALPRLESTLKATHGVAALTPPTFSPNGALAIITLYPTTSPQAAATTNLLQHLRSVSVPRAVAGSGLVVRIGGATATSVDFSHVLAQKIPLFIAVVVAVSALLLVVVFRSLVVPLTASFMNMLSVGAAFGIMEAVFQQGIGKQLIGITRNGPVDVFVPVLLFSILFGLSMDYEVFLVSRIHEEWVALRDNRQAVTRGQAETGRVITAAASIMVLVFASFIFGGTRVIKEFGVGFAGAVFIDAFVIRTVIVPSVMHLLGRSNWWLPSWLDRRLPHLAIDAPDGERPLPKQPASALVER